MDSTYDLTPEIPTVEDYCRLRREAGLSPRSTAAAAAGLPNTVVARVIRQDGRAVAMGRVVGDGLFYQLVDIAVQPEHQGRGLGKAIVAGLLEELKRQAPAEAYVSLIADGAASELYARFGFKPTMPASMGMAQWINR